MVVLESWSSICDEDDHDTAERAACSAAAK